MSRQSIQSRRGYFRKYIGGMCSQPRRGFSRICLQERNIQHGRGHVRWCMNGRNSHHREAYGRGVLVWGAAHLGLHLAGGVQVQRSFSLGKDLAEGGVCGQSSIGSSRKYLRGKHKQPVHRILKKVPGEQSQPRIYLEKRTQVERALRIVDDAVIETFKEGVSCLKGNLAGGSQG